MWKLMVLSLMKSSFAISRRVSPAEYRRRISSSRSVREHWAAPKVMVFRETSG